MMTSFGQTLKCAREAKGLSCSQVAAKTHILVQIVEDMENEKFQRIAAPIYGRGFVRLLADCLELESKPLILQFMALYEGREEPFVQTSEKSVEKAPLFQAPPSSPPVPEAPLPMEMAEPPAPPLSSAPRSLADLWSNDLPTDLPPVRESFDPPPVPAPEPMKQPQTQPLGKRFRLPLADVSENVMRSMHNIPRRAWRIALVGGALLILLVAMGWGTVKLYEATSHEKKPIPSQKAVSPVQAQVLPVKPMSEDQTLCSTNPDLPLPAVFVD